MAAVLRSPNEELHRKLPKEEARERQTVGRLEPRFNVLSEEVYASGGCWGRIHYQGTVRRHLTQPYINAPSL